jgi:ubiquinone/menaquinone biosynthesis C-methylase UbiE
VADVYVTIAEAEPAVVERLTDILELRAADAQQREMRETYLSDIDFPAGARVLEVGCGPGPVARALASRPARHLPNLTFVEGDARALPLEDGSFDVVVFHTTLCHVPGPELALAETRRVLRTGGSLGIFDGDYATATCARDAFDPLQACADACVDYLVYDRWLVRRLPRLVGEAGFEFLRFRGYSYVEAPSSDGYMLSIADRGAEPCWRTAGLAST